MAFPDELLAGGEHPQLVVSPHGSEVVAPPLWLLVAGLLGCVALAIEHPNSAAVVCCSRQR